MAGICRLGDSCTGHGSFPSRVNDEGSPNVFVNGRAVHRQGDHWVTHSNPTPSSHDGTASGGSSNVFANGKPIMRIGDTISCGSLIATGSPNVFAN